MKSNVKGYRQKRRFWNRLRKQKKLHREELENWDKIHNDWFCTNVFLREELGMKTKECNSYKRELLVFQIAMFIILVISLIKVVL